MRTIFCFLDESTMDRNAEKLSGYQPLTRGQLKEELNDSMLQWVNSFRYSFKRVGGEKFFSMSFETRR